MDVSEFIKYAWACIIIVIIAFGIYLGSSMIISNYQEHIVTGKVLKKDIVVGNHGAYCVICTDKEFLSTNKLDIYNQVKENYTYNFTVYGSINSMDSKYRTIKKVEEYKPDR